MVSKQANKGFSLVIIMLVVLATLVLGGIILFSSLLNNPDLEKQITSRIYQNSPSPTTAPSDTGLSGSTDLDTIEAEYEATQINDFEVDMDELEESANLLE